MKLRYGFFGGALLALLFLCNCQPAPALEITFGGDIVLARDGISLFTNSNPWEGIDAAVASQHPASGDWIFAANLESALGETKLPGESKSSRGYDLCAPLDQAKILSMGGISLVNLANNHEGDCGEDKSKETDGLQKVGISTIGPKLQPEYITTSTGKVGFLAADLISDPKEEDLLLDAVAATRPQCDFLVVSLHWGNEYQSGPTKEQQGLAQKLANAGVDVLWGTHPHVLQKMVWVKASAGNHEMLTMYSLGNLLSDQWMLDAAGRGALVTVKIQRGKIVNISVLPVEMSPAAQGLVQPDLATAEKIKTDLQVTTLYQPGLRVQFLEK